MSSLLKHKSTHPVQREKGKERTSSSNKDANTEKAVNIDTANKVQQHDHGYKGFFKRHFSLNLKHRNTSTADGNGTTHSSRMVSPSPRVVSKSLSLSLPLSSPGPASPTVQHTDHVPTPLREKLYLDKGRDSGNDKKQSTSRDKPTTSTTTQNKTISSSTKPNPIPQSQNIDSSNTPSKDVSEKEDKEKERENTSNNKITKTQSHTLQYEYFPVISESKPVDPESGTLQGTEEIINKAMLQNVVQRDLERRKDVAKTPPSSSLSSSSSSSSPSPPPSFYSSPRVSRSGSPVVTVPTTAETETETETDTKGVKASERLSEPRISATAAMMMKLYKDESQMVYEKTSQKQKQTHTAARQNSNTYSDYSETSDYEHRETCETYATEHDQSSVPSLSSSPAPYTGEEAVTLTNNNNNNDRPGSVSPTPSRSISDTDSTSNVDVGVGIGMSDDDETVQVVLKWRDPLENPSKTRIFLVSEDIVSTLLASNSSITINIVDKKKFKMCMLFDYSSNEWFVPGLLLPPGIYRLQFLVNGVMTHSSFLPTATNSAGTIVNWFEVLPGYNKIEPFRDDTQIQSSNVNVDKTQTFTSNALSSTSLTDYAGISRSDSVVVGKSLLTSLKLTNLQLEDKPKLTYSNQIPEIFKFDPPENPDEPPKVAFSLTLPKVVDFNQDTLFANIQSAGKMSAEDAEAFFLNRFKVPNLPIYLNSTYLNKNFGNDQNHIIPHVNLNHLLTSSIKDDMVCVGCTTRYAGKFITQVLYYPCSVEASSQGTGKEEEDV